MAKVILEMTVSLDGFVAGPRREWDTKPGDIRVFVGAERTG